MLAFVPAEAQRILDVGCGAGTFASRLKRERGAEVWGVELDPEAAKTASAEIDRVLVGDALAVLDELPAGTFDCIVLNDILEHLVEPEQLLVGLGPKLTATGCLVASIPNVRHFPHLWQLVVRGEWTYTDEGILDRSHLRFFTRKSIKSLFTQCDYRLDEVVGIHPTRSWKWRLFDLLTLGCLREMRYLQFACVARWEKKG
jgi:2-polyprenyl-3-methyl-5-hydroxy-6-metoxy-1,4-benzoquinol methylase